MRFRIIAQFENGTMYDDSKTGSVRVAVDHARALVEERGGEVTVFDDGRPVPAEEFIARHAVESEA